MFLDNLLLRKLPHGTENVLQLIVTQLNLLLCLVNDVLDIKLIEEGKFQKKMERFEPQKLLDFIVAMFEPQAEMQQT